MLENPWLLLVLGLAVGLAIGYAVAAWRRPTPKDLSAEVTRLESELERYREDVNSHFVKTADLVNSMTRSYKAVYDHLEEGAYRLVGEETLRQRLTDAPTDDPVMLEYIGSRRAIDEGTPPVPPRAPGARPAPLEPRAVPPTQADWDDDGGSAEVRRDVEREVEHEVGREVGPDGEVVRTETRTETHVRRPDSDADEGTETERTDDPPKDPRDDRRGDDRPKHAGETSL